MKKHPFAQAKLTGSVSLGSAVRPKPKFGIRNTDSDVGKFLITFAFDNGTDRATENVPQTVGPGGKMTASLTSPLVIEELDLQGESGLFHEYNQLGKPANPTRRRFINQASLHNAIAARVMEGSVLKNNVETVTNNLTRNTNKVMTFNTLASGVQQGFKTLDEMNFEDTRNFLITFVNELSAIRPEVGYLPISERLKIREATIGDSGLIFQAYFRLAGDLQNYPNWPEMLEQLGEPFITRDDDGKILYQGDLMSRQNPLWRQTVLVEGKNGRISIANRTESREYAYRTLRDVVGIDN